MSKQCNHATMQDKIGEVTGIAIASVLFVSLVGAYIYIKLILKRDFHNGGGISNDNPSIISKFYEKLFVNFEDFFGGTVAKYSISGIVILSISSVLLTFNALLITPLVQVCVPDQEIFKTGVEIGRDVWIYPGQMLLTLIGFMVTLSILFGIAMFLNSIWENHFAVELLKFIATVLVLGTFGGLLLWNINDLRDNLNCPVVEKPTGPASALKVPTARKPKPPIAPVNMFMDARRNVSFTI